MSDGSAIFLRKIKPGDEALLLRWENDPDNWLVSGTTARFSAETIKAYVNSVHDLFISGQLRMMICKDEVNDAVGCVDLFEFDPVHLRAGVGILIDRQSRKKGYGALALLHLADYCESIGVRNLWCSVLANNPASMRLFLSCGYHQAGLHKNWFNAGDQWIDEYIYQLQLTR